MTCPICYDDMDMKEFRDDLPGTDTCFKLECGHAFHTKCIVQFLTRTEHKCPACNVHRTPEQSLEIEGVLRNLLRDIKKDCRIRIAINEHREATSEYKNVMKQLQTEAEDWIANRATELKFNEHKIYYKKSITAVMNTAQEVAKERGPKFLAAVNSQRTATQQRYGLNIVNRVLFGKNCPGNRDWKLRYPRVWIRL
jgi:hypothetical protein